MPAPRKRRPSARKPAKQSRELREGLQPLPAQDDCAGKVIACIRQQTGGKVISSDATLSSLGVDSFILAGCLNEKFGRNYSAADFPSSMTVQDVIDKVCG